jgi:pSer/pThr/pTyr-binding forkhead associated (FHA) protein
MYAKLVVVAGAQPTTITLRRLPAVVGRSGQSSLMVRQPFVSRWHCEIYEHDGELVVRDLDSANGTFVNGLRIDGPTLLFPGDQLRVGTVVFRAEYTLPTGRTHKRSRSPLVWADDLDPTPSHLSYTEREEGSFLSIDPAPTPNSSDLSARTSPSQQSTPTELFWDDEYYRPESAADDESSSGKREDKPTDNHG